MKYNSMCFLVDVTDDSMEPKLMKDDLVTVRSGFEADETHMAAVLVTDDVQKTTKLYIRNFRNMAGLCRNYHSCKSFLMQSISAFTSFVPKLK